VARIVFTGGAEYTFPGTADAVRDVIQRCAQEGKWVHAGGNTWINPAAVAYVDDGSGPPPSLVMEGIPGAHS
jgi:hypothetical protein